MQAGLIIDLQIRLINTISLMTEVSQKATYHLKEINNNRQSYWHLSGWEGLQKSF